MGRKASRVKHERGKESHKNWSKDELPEGYSPIWPIRCGAARQGMRFGLVALNRVYYWMQVCP